MDSNTLFEIYADKSYCIQLLIALAAGVIIFLYLFIMVPHAIIIFGFPWIVIFYGFIVKSIELYENKPVVVISSDYIYCNKFPLKYISTLEIDNVFLSLKGTETLFDRDINLKNSKFYYSFEISFNNLEEFILKFPWNWKSRLKNRKCLSIDLSHYDVVPGDILKFAKVAIGKSSEADESDIKLKYYLF